AEEDLRLRGAGEVLGTRQSGLPEFRLADLAAHGERLATARDDARLIVERDPQLESGPGQALRTLLYLFERDSVVATLPAGWDRAPTHNLTFNPMQRESSHNVRTAPSVCSAAGSPDGRHRGLPALDRAAVGRGDDATGDRHLHTLLDRHVEHDDVLARDED